MQEIKLKELAAAVKVLNDSDLIKEKIKIIGQTKEIVVKAFVKAVKAIPDDKRPKAVAEFYNLIVPPVKKPVKAEKGKAPTQTDFIRDAIRKKLSKENLIKDLAKAFTWDEQRAKKRMAVYEKAYGEMGKNDKLI